MKKLKLFTLTLTMCLSVILASCGGKNAIEQVEGHWVLATSPDSKIDIIINDNGTGQLTMFTKDYAGEYKLLLKDNITFTEIDNELIFKAESTSASGNLYVKDGRLYSATGDPFTKLSN